MSRQTLTSASSILIFVLIVCILVAQSSATEKLDLKLRLKAGQKYGVRITMEDRRSQTIEGQKEDYSDMVAWVVSLEVLEVDANGVASLKATYRSAQTRTQGPMGQMEYDSTKKGKITIDNVLGQMFEPVVGESLVFKISPKAEIVEIRGLEELMGRVAEKSAGYDESVRALVNEEVITSWASYMMIDFPNNPVGIGDSWVEKGSIWTMGIPHVIEQIYTLKERKEGVAIVNIRAKMTDSDDENYIDMGSIKVNVRMSGTKGGIAEIDESSGWMIRGNWKIQLSGEMKVAPNDEIPEGTTVPLSTEMIWTIEPME